MTQLSPHFMLEELIRSQVATRNGLDNTPDPAIVANLIRLATALETVRAVLGNRPIQIDSGYRSPIVNGLVGGVASSAHCDGRAADFICPDFGDPKAICQELVIAGVAFDQLIFEGSWVHFGIPIAGIGGRKMQLTAHFSPSSGTTYTTGFA
jgi:hypothetical protein